MHFFQRDKYTVNNNVRLINITQKIKKRKIQINILTKIMEEIWQLYNIYIII